MEKRIVTPDLYITEEAFGYLDRSAKIRRISTGRLLSRMLAIILEEKLILSIMDDDSQPQPAQLPGEETRSHYYDTSTRRNRSTRS